MSKNDLGVLLTRLLGLSIVVQYNQRVFYFMMILGILSLRGEGVYSPGHTIELMHGLAGTLTFAVGVLIWWCAPWISKRIVI